MIRKIQIFCFFLLLFLFVGAVSANEDFNLNNPISQDETHLETNDIEMFYKDGTSFVVELTNTNEDITIKQVNFTVNDVTYNRKFNSSGQAKLNLNLAPGEYQIKTDSILNNQKLSVINNIKIKEMNSTLVGNKIVELGYCEGKYVVSLIGGYNQPLIGKTVTFSINGVDYTKVTGENGVASIKINLKPGKYSISTKFSETFHRATSFSSLLDIQIYNTKFLSNSSKFKNPNVEYKVKLIYGDNNPVKNHYVLFKIQGSSSLVKTDDNGFAIFKKVLNPGLYTISFEFLGSEGYYGNINRNTFEVQYNGENNIENTVQLETNDIQMFYKDGTAFTIKTLENGQGVEAKTISITINNITYYRTSNTLGNAKLNLNLAPGEYKILTNATFDNQVLSVVNTVIINEMNSTLFAEKEIELGFQQGKYVVSLIGGYNQPLIGKIVTFSINGVDYTRTTNNDGCAGIAINLAPGTYTIFAKFSEVFHTPTSIESKITVGIFSTRFISNFTKFNQPTIEYSVKLVDEKNRPVKDVFVEFLFNGNSKKVMSDDNGIAIFKDVLKAGIHNISFSYLGSAGYLKSQGSNSFEVTYSQINIQSQDFETCVDSPLRYAVFISDSSNSILINETIKSDVYQDNKFIKTIESKTFEDGIARVNLDLNAGNYVVKNYLNDDGPSNFNNVTIKPATLIVSSSNLFLNRKGEYYTIIIKNNETNSPVANKTVIFSINGIDYKRTTDDNGHARLKLNLNEGEYQVSYYIYGNGKYTDLTGNNFITIVNTLSVPTINILTFEIVRKSSFCKIKLTDVNELSLGGKEVFFTIDGISYKRTTDDDGIAKLKINLRNGIYKVKVDFKGDNLFSYNLKNFNLIVNTTPSFNHTLSIKGKLNFKELSCPIIREFSIEYNGVQYELDYESDRNFLSITDENSYLISNDGIESVYDIEQGIEFKSLKDNILITFYGKSLDVGQFSVIFSSIKSDSCHIVYVVDNEVVATIKISTFYYSDDVTKFLGAGYSFSYPDFANTSFKSNNHSFNRQVQLDKPSSGVSLKNRPVFDDFNTIQSYVLTSKKVTSQIMENEINKAFNFHDTYVKYAYELYLAGLITIWTSDEYSEDFAKKLNVTWNKNFQIVLANIDWTQLSLDSYTSINVNGNETNSKLFKLNYGIIFSLCEELGLKSTDNDASSAVSTIFTGIYEGKDFIIDEKDGFITIKLVNANDKIIIDTLTGDTKTLVILDVDDFVSNLVFKGAVANKFTGASPNVEDYWGFMKNNLVRDFNGYFKTIGLLLNSPKIVMGDALDTAFTIGSLSISVSLGSPQALFPLIKLGVDFQQYTLNFRNKYASNDCWQYFASHGPITEIKTIAVFNSKTYYTDYIEIPYDDDGNLDIERGIYMDSLTGKRNLTEDEKDVYSTFK